MFVGNPSGDQHCAQAVDSPLFALAAGFAAAHLLPTWSDLSDSFPDQHVAVFSWIAATAEISTAAVLGITGLSAWRRNLSPSAPPPGDR